MLETPTQTFAYAEASIAQAKQRMAALLLPLGILALVLLTPSADGIFVLGVAVLGVLIYVQHRWMYRHLRRMRLHVQHGGLVRESGTIRQTLPWSTITRVRVRHSPRGEVQAIELDAVAQPRMVLAGYEHMAELGHVIVARLPPLVAVETKRSRLDLNHPPVFVAFVLATGLAVVAVLMRSGWDAAVVSSVLHVGTGLAILLEHPQSRHNPNFRPMEVGVAAVLIGVGLIRLLAGV